MQGGRITAVGGDAEVMRRCRPRDEGRRPPRTDGDARLRRQPRPPDQLGRRPTPLRPRRGGRDRGVPRAHRRVRRRQPGAAVDPRQRLVPRPLPGRPREPRAPRPCRPGPPRLPAQQGRPRCVGQQPGARDRRDHRGHGRPARRPDRAQRRRVAPGHASRGRPGPRRAPHPADQRRRARPRADREPGLPAFAGHHELAGRHRRARWPRDVPAGGRPWPADGAGRGRAVVGARRRAGAGRGTSWRDAPRDPWAGTPRPA